MKQTGLQSIRNDQIEVGDRLRVAQDGHVQMLAASIGASTLRQPIEVRRRGKKDGDYLLIAGAHRLAAVKLIGWQEVPAFVYDATDDQARLAEIDENLVRHELGALDKAVFLKEREQVYLRLFPEAAHGGDRVSKKARERQMVNLVACFSADVCGRTGLSERAVRRALMIASKLTLAVKLRIAGTPLARNQSELEALAKRPPAEQIEIAGLLLADPPQAKRVADAVAMLAGVKSVERSADERATEALIGAWERAGRKARRAFLEHLVENSAAELRDLLFEAGLDASTGADAPDGAGGNV